MEAIIISLLLFFSNTDFSLDQPSLDQSTQNTQTTTTDGGQGYDDYTVPECSSGGGKISLVDIEGF